MYMHKNKIHCFYGHSLSSQSADNCQYPVFRYNVQNKIQILNNQNYNLLSIMP